MTGKKKKGDYLPHANPGQATACTIPGCREPGLYKAPRTRDALHDYCWFCLDHIREHNQKWDYFAGMDADDIESFIRDATTGHRPTWNRENRIRQQYHQLQDALYEFLRPGAKAKKAAPPLPAKIERALSILDLGWPCTAGELKTRYRALVKKHHPDVNKGNKQSEEAFKKITASYHQLVEHIKNG